MEYNNIDISEHIIPEANHSNYNYNDEQNFELNSDVSYEVFDLSIIEIIKSSINTYNTDLSGFMQPEDFITNLVAELMINSNMNVLSVERHIRSQNLSSRMSLALTNYVNNVNMRQENIVPIDENGNVAGESISAIEYQRLHLGNSIESIASELGISVDAINFMINNAINKRNQTYSLIQNDYCDLTENFKEQKECVICCDDFAEENKIVILPCNHIFHSSCISNWISESAPRCPCCQQDITQNGVENDDGTYEYTQRESLNNESLNNESLHANQIINFTITNPETGETRQFVINTALNNVQDENTTDVNNEEE